MKNLKAIALLFIIIAISFSSCSNDNAKANINNQLVGEWQRSDATNVLEYKLIFNDDNTGVRIHREGYTNTAIATLSTSSASEFNWSIKNNIIIIDDIDGEVINTPFNFNSDGHLFLSNLTNLYFKKVG